MKGAILKCLNLLLSVFWRDKSAPEPLSLEETLSRYLFQKNQYNSQGRVKQAAFLPASNKETSVFRKSRMSSSEYDYSKQHVSSIKKKPLKAVALTELTSIPPELTVSPEEKKASIRWHANIESWPDSKDEQKLLAQQIAQKSRIE